MRQQARAALGLACLAWVLSGCGRKAEPLPPIIEVPETTRDLVGVQVGNGALLMWSYPQLTRAGQQLRDLARVEVWKLDVPPGQESIGQGPSGEEMRRQLMVARGHLIARLEGESLEAATHGSSLQYTDSLPPVQGGPSPGALWYAVRSRRRDGTASALSNIVTVQPKVPPAQITSVEAKVDATGISLTWQEVPGASYVIERRDPSGGAPWTIVATDRTSNQFTDLGLAQGTVWRYRVRSVVAGVCGEPSAEKTVDYSDVYPPEPPSGLVCLPEAGAVRLRWDWSPEAGATYEVLRRPSVGAWVSLAAGLAVTELVDRQPLPEASEYAVKVVDRAGNASTETTCKVRSAD